MKLEDELRWLVDRACISDLLVAFAHALDTKCLGSEINWTRPN